MLRTAKSKDEESLLARTSREFWCYLSGTVCKYCDRGYVCLAGAKVSNPHTSSN